MASDTPGTYTLNIYQGDSLTPRVITITSGGVPVNLTGATVAAGLRKVVDGVAVGDVTAITCTLSGTPTDGKITLSIPIATSALIDYEEGEWAMRILFSGGTVKKTYLSGPALIQLCPLELP